MLRAICFITYIYLYSVSVVDVFFTFVFTLFKQMHNEWNTNARKSYWYYYTDFEHLCIFQIINVDQIAILAHFNHSNKWKEKKKITTYILLFFFSTHIHCNWHEKLHFLHLFDVFFFFGFHCNDFRSKVIVKTTNLPKCIRILQKKKLPVCK